MPYKVWKITIGGHEHVVKIEQGSLWGSFKLKVDGAIVKKRFFPASRVDFKVADTAAVLTRLGQVETRWELYIGGELVKDQVSLAGHGYEYVILFYYVNKITQITWQPA